MGFWVTCWFCTLPLSQLPTDSEAQSIRASRGFPLLMRSAFTELYFFEKKREEDESFCSVTKTIAFCAEQRFVWLFFSLEINFIETLYCCGELKASSIYRYFDNIARSQYLVTSRRDIFIQIWLLLFLILAGIRHFNRSTIFRFLGGNAKRYN